VFDRFRQGDSGSTREFGGLGLGLALVRHFVELHGGTVEASSEGLGKGATFRIILPIMAAHSQANRTHPTTGGKAPRSHASLVGVSVLTLDDDPDALHLLGEILRDAGATVVAARSAEEAFGRLDERLPDVIVADIGMPRANGYEFIGELRRRGPEQGGAIPAAALTAYARAEDRTAALVAGFQLHLAKPIDPDELLAAVHAIARHRSR
jgi:CheY-like chemotaxis protein